MEQVLTFLGIIVLAVIALLVLNSPGIFLGVFVGGIAFYEIRRKIKGWKLPKDIKDTHS